MFTGALGTLRTAVDQVVAPDPELLGDAALAEEIIGVQSQIDRLQGQVARLAHVGHRRGIGAADGSPSTAAWLRRHTGMREGDARGVLDAGDACAGPLAATGAAWRSGEISTGAARTIIGARVEGHDLELTAVEPTLLAYARERRYRDLQRACARVRFLATADGSCPRDHDGLFISQTYGGRTYLTADLSADGAEVVTTAIHGYTEPPTDADTRTPARRRADALVAMARVALAALDGGDPVRARPAATIVIDWATLTDNAVGRLDGGFTGPMHPSAIDRLLCDCSVARVVTGPGSVPIDLGRSRRTASRAQRRALVVRDGGCRFPGCTRPPAWTDVHHVVHWRSGGATDLINQVLLCDHHHHVVHQPGWITKFDGEEFRVIRPDGVEIRGP